MLRREAQNRCPSPLLIIYHASVCNALAHLSHRLNVSFVWPVISPASVVRHTFSCNVISRVGELGLFIIRGAVVITLGELGSQLMVLRFR